MAKAVVNSSKKAMVVADFPFGSYESSPEQALVTGVRFFKESKVGAVKLEGGAKVVPQIKKLVAAGIPVMGHLGLTPQSVHALGGFKVQGRGDDGDEILKDAKALELAGVFAIVLEAIPAQLADEITKSISIPTIGIGAGSGCDGQVLVWTDLVGITEKIPKLAKAYRNLRKEIADAASEFARDVANGDFPGKEQSFS
jgi:3-methyl-2-oxobutanoate hydroxymethyltransferase